MIDINPKLPEMTASIEGEVTSAICDVRVSEQVDLAIETIESALGPIDALWEDE